MIGNHLFHPCAKLNDRFLVHPFGSENDNERGGYVQSPSPPADLSIEQVDEEEEDDADREAGVVVRQEQHAGEGMEEWQFGDGTEGFMQQEEQAEASQEPDMST